MTPDRRARVSLPEPVRRTLDEFTGALGLRIVLSRVEGGDRSRLYPDGPEDPPPPDGECPKRVLSLAPREGATLELALSGPAAVDLDAVGGVLLKILDRMFDISEELRFFTYELAERYEEINLLYSISETLGSVLRLEDSARVILEEVCDVLGAGRGSLWVHDAENGVLRLTASVGAGGVDGPISEHDPKAVTARVFREGRARITSPPRALVEKGSHEPEIDSFLSVPIRYSPPSGKPRTVGVINLIGRHHGGRFTASDQKLLSAIASQVGAALENSRLIQETLRQQRMSSEMELAHNLQMKLLPPIESLGDIQVAARVDPAEQVGGDFYQLFRLPQGRIGVMIGDVSSHGFPAALIMALAMSAATIYAAEFGTPSMVLRHLDDALHDELESTEMYLTLFYGVLDPAERKLVFSNAGHPHGFLLRTGGTWDRLAATDPPVGIGESSAYGQVEVSLDPDIDLLVLFTDGLLGSLASENTMPGESTVLDIAARLRNHTPAEIVDALFEKEHGAGSVIPPDDRTAIVLKV
jgi:sigma-B regulation protein RsbU (phosphoserine phosphatase)